METSPALQLRVCCRIKLCGDWEGSSDILRKKIRVSRGRMLNDATTDQTFESHLLRPDLFLRLALGNYCGAKAGTQVLRQFVELRVPVDLDGLLGGVADNVAVVAPGKMVFEFGLGAVVEHAVEVVRQIVQKFRAFHCLPSPLTRFWK